MEAPGVEATEHIGAVTGHVYEALEGAFATVPSAKRNAMSELMSFERMSSRGSGA